MPLSLNETYLDKFIGPGELSAIWPQVETAHRILAGGNGPGHDFLGWVDLPEEYDREEFARIKEAAAEIRENCDIFIVIGIGGSYLGARAAIEFIRSPLHNQFDKPEIYFAGNSISPSALNGLLALCEGKDVCVNVISKSGTTTEPALAFRVFRELLERKYGREGAASRIYCTTDKAKGTLRELAGKEGYQTFVIPDDVGGRFSVLTPVGLLPIAVAGCDLDALMKGAAGARSAYRVIDENNAALRYAAIRNILARKGFQAEVLVGYEPALALTAEWYKQLFGESEGKDGKGLFPASMIFSTDLHSLGQFVQDGSKMLFETVLQINEAPGELVIGDDPEDLDGLNFLSGKKMSFVNNMAMQGTVLAHTEGGVPNLILELEKMDEYHFGWLVYFFELACAVSGYLLGVNPFDQPGVEHYKKNMFALLGKPGYQELRDQLLAKR